MWVDVGNSERYLAAHRTLLESMDSPLWHMFHLIKSIVEQFYLRVQLSSELVDAQNLWLGQNSSLSVE